MTWRGENALMRYGEGERGQSSDDGSSGDSGVSGGERPRLSWAVGVRIVDEVIDER